MARETAAAFAEHEARIREHLSEVEIRHTGGTSAAGLLTSGDVDVHVRVSRQSFVTAREALRGLYEPQHETKWHAESAFFFAPGSQPLVEIALTVSRSLDDLHHGEAAPNRRERGSEETL
ncbi:MAG: GrpB family protein [Gaiellaceae bacterium MAG52_C11]|nr:GrpB family protein [Candidatus Gaiellasilicea maunaloa]